MKLLLAIEGIPQIPNIITFIRGHINNAEISEFLHDWEDLIFSFLIASAISLVFYIGTIKKEMIPYGFQNFLEWTAEFFESVVVGIIGPDGKKFVPFLGTLFIYILTMNLVGLIPLLKSPSSNLNITIALAICVFVLVQYLNVKNMGIKGYLYHLAGSPTNTVGWIISPLMFPIELLTQIARPITLALRLFGNILGEKILIGFFVVISVTMFFLIPIQTPFMFLGLLTSVMQAMVFTLLSTIYIVLSIPHTEEHKHNH